MSARHNIETMYRLSPVQEGILFHVLERDDATLYVGQYTCTIEGALDPERLRACWQALVDRHAALRTFFIWRRRETPLQVVRMRAGLPWAYEDLRGLDPEARELRTQDVLRSQHAAGFDLDRAPLIRLVALRVGDERFRIGLTYHHIAMDGWSLRLLLNEAADAYGGGGAHSDSRPEARPFSDFIDWLQDRDWARSDDFWRRMLADVESSTSVPPTRDPRGIDGEGHETLVRTLEPGQHERIARFAREHHLTLNSVLVGAWALLLARSCDREDVVIGTTWAGRPPELRGCQDTVGMFINTLPLRIRVFPTPVREWLQQIQDTLAAVRDHELTPLVRVHRASGLHPGAPLFESLVVLQSVPGSEPGSMPLRVADERYLEHSHYPLALLVRPGEPGEGLHLSLVRDGRRHSHDFAERLLAQLEMLLRLFTAEPAALVTGLDAMPPGERRALLEASQGPRMAFDSPPTLDALVARAACADPGATALVEQERSVDYATLDARVERLAARLRSLCPGTRCYGAVFLERSVEALIATLAVLRAGGAFVPLDPDHPPARARQILDDLSTARRAEGREVVLITRRELAARLPAAGRTTLFVDDDSGDAEPACPDAGPVGDDLAYVMFTSGSTGRPKGVRVPHAAIVNSTLARNHFYGQAPERFLLLSSLASDSSIAGIFWTLCGGGALVLPPARIEQSMVDLAALIRRQRITHMLCLPSLHGLLLEHAPPDHLGTLRCVVVAGEACAPEVVAHHLARLPGARLFNEYGPSEASVWATVAELDQRAASGTVPIGRPIANTCAFLLDGSQRLVTPGLPGELHLGGAGLALDYLTPPEATSERFAPDSFAAGHGGRLYRTGDRARMLPDGQLEFIGRVDHQIKIRGFRVEPEEIERVLKRLDGVADAAVTLAPVDAPAVHAARGRSELTAFLVAGDTAPEPQALREALRRELPEHMVPQHFVRLEVLPRAPGGKLDRARLRERTVPLTERTVLTPARSAAERELLSIWVAVLGRDDIGIDDDFFELGGDSLLSIRVLARAHRAGIEIRPGDFFAHPTIAGQAALAAAAPHEPPDGRGAPMQSRPATASLSAASLDAIGRQLGKADAEDR